MAILCKNQVRARHPMAWRSGFRRKLFGNLQSYAYNCQRNKKCSPATVLVISVMGYTLGLPEEEASNQWTVFTLTVLIHAVH